ncbi:MAG: DUF3108 domain-containing protein [Chitinophagales bacterium]
MKKWALLSLAICMGVIYHAHATKELEKKSKVSPSKEAMCSLPMDYHTFQSGEKLTFKIYYNWSAIWMKAGNVTFDVSDAYLNNKTVYHVDCVGKTASAFNWVYQVDDHYETYIDPANLLPLKYIRDIKQGKFTKKNQFRFFHDRNEVYIDYRIRKGEVKAKDEVAPIKSCTQDVLSTLYYARAFDFKNSNLTIGDTIPIDVFLDGKSYNVHLRYLGKDELKANIGGKYRCLKFAPLLLSSYAFGEGGETMVIWVTDDSNKLPLLIESPLRVGWAKAYLDEYENLVYPLDAKIK